MRDLGIGRREFLALSGALAVGGVRAVEPKPQALPAGNAFATDLYGQLRGEAGNLFYSPFSISTALGMTAAGAKGETRAEFVKVLHLPAGEGAANAQYAEQIAAINGSGAKKRPYQLSTANALWAQKGYPWRQEYVTLVTTLFGAAVEDVEYSNPEAARATINEWVEKQTQEKIKDLIPAGAITPLTRLVLTNAIYFKGDWLTPFKKDQTQEAPFTLADGKTTRVPLMTQEKMLGYGEQPGLQLLELPYKGRELSMVVALPREAGGLAKLEADLTAERWQSWTKTLRPATVKVFLPRFKIETKYTLNQPLQALGLKRAFREQQADFSGMHTGAEKPFISLVVHKAFVDVNEEGTEAAAATGVVVGVTSVRVPQEPKLFRADRPFLFAIRQNKTGSLLFMGRVSKPA